MALQIKKRGRPSKADLLARAKSAPKPRTDSQILTDLRERFDVLTLLTKGVVGGDIRAMVVTGAPGVGKTFTVEQILERSGNTHEIVRASMSAINLYMLAHRMRHPGSVIVLDDADMIFADEEAMNILKALCDSSSERKVSYMKEADALKADDIPKSFIFQGAMIFISNLDFQKYVDEGKNKFAQHFEALMSRSLYLDLRLHSRAELGIWVNYMAESARIFDIDNVPMNVRPKIMNFLKVHREDLRELSIRTLKKLNQMAKAHPNEWESVAKVLFIRSK